MPPRRAHAWAKLPDEKLLDLRLRDLGLRLEDAPELAERVETVLEELREKGLRFRPHFWLGSEWFSPVGVPGVAIPFYLAHARLRRLERSIMLEVEGGTKRSCLRILRHEVGHAIQTAFALHRRASWRRAFGEHGKAYPDSYRPRPYSKRYVLHIDNWYAQSHPDEDFAETFAVWLTPGSQWRKRYRGWPALRKLEAVDAMMADIAEKTPTARSRRRVDPVDGDGTTLRALYEEKRRRYAFGEPDVYDADLRKLFRGDPQDRSLETATRFLTRRRGELARLVGRWTGQHPYTVDQVLQIGIARCKEMGLRAPAGVEDEALLREATALLTVQTLTFLQQGGRRVYL